MSRAGPEPGKIDKTRVSVIIVEGVRVHRRAWIVLKGFLLPSKAHDYSMEIRSDPFEFAKTHLFDTSSWGEFCDVTLSLKQAWQPDRAGWVKIDDYRCRQAFRQFANLLNRAGMDLHFVGMANVCVHTRARKRRDPRPRVTPMGVWRVRSMACSLRNRIALKLDAIALEKMIRECWAKVEWGYGRICPRPARTRVG